MKFSEKLSFLIRHFNSSNSKLAKSIAVDPSLVSKWVHDRRVPPIDSPYISQIAEYFLKISSPEYPQAMLINLLQADFPEQNLEIFTVRKMALVEWLSCSNVSRQHLNELTDRAIAPSQRWSKLFDSNPPNEKHGLTNEQPFLFPRTDRGQAPGEIGSYEFFRGRTGRRQVVLNFMQAVLETNVPVELLLASQEDVQWILEEAEFLAQWSMMLKEILRRGHKIKIIHTVNRDISQINAMIKHWIPLHLTGKIESYYHPKYEQPALVKTMFLARGIASVLSISTPPGNDSEYTFHFQDPLVMGLLEQFFQSFLAQCRPLLKAYAQDDISRLSDEIDDMQKKPGYIYTLNDGLSSLTMPFSLYARLIERSSLSTKVKKERLDLHEHWSEVFLQAIKHHRFREICPLEAVNLLINEDVYLYPGSEFFLSKSLNFEPADLLEHLVNLIWLLENNENYELLLINNSSNLMPGGISLTFKEDYLAIISSSNDKSPYAIATSEGNLLQAFEAYFEDIYQQLPPNNRNKAWIINKLKRKASQLAIIVGLEQKDIS